MQRDIMVVKHIKRVAKSSLAAETLALSEGLDNAFYIVTLYSAILHGNSVDNTLPIENLC